MFKSFELFSIGQQSLQLTNVKQGTQHRPHFLTEKNKFSKSSMYTIKSIINGSYRDFSGNNIIIFWIQGLLVV